MACVLTVAGEPSFRQALRRMLELVGHEVVESGDGPHGLRLYGRHGIDVIVADIIMPEKEGLGAIFNFRTSFPRSKIVGLSDRGVFSARQLRRIAEAIKIDAVLTRPLTGLDLNAAVDGLLR